MNEPINIPTNPNEGMLLDLSNQMKEIVEEKDELIKKISEKYMNSKKLLGKIYGLIRVVQEQIDDKGTPAGTDDYIIDWLIAEIRGNISDYLYTKEEKLLGIYGY
tara:strand:+ start:2871 stop:3185 length:315 start_codon:yes stop_codon:yes gene_type:complete